VCDAGGKGKGKGKGTISSSFSARAEERVCQRGRRVAVSLRPDKKGRRRKGADFPFAEEVARREVEGKRNGSC